MNAVIPITTAFIGGQPTQAANARDLHEYLEPATDFNHWIARRIEEYGFEEGKDFWSFLAESTGGRPPKEYTISLNMAKELAMVERNAKGKQARQYFIECERRAKECMQPAELSRMDILQLAMASEQARIKAEEQLALAAPKVEYVDRYVAANGAKGFRQVAKLLGANEHEFRAWLQDEKIMYRLGGEWTAYQQHIDAGRLVTRAGVAKRNEHAFNATYFTPKGVNWVAGEWGKHLTTKGAGSVAKGVDRG